MMADDSAQRRQVWKTGPDDRTPAGWLALNDDELLFRIEALPAGHDEDAALLEVVRSQRHFFVRQEAAKKIGNPDHLKSHSGDRHIGQILVRNMTRDEDVAYLERLVRESRHIEVRKAAEAQLVLIEKVRRKSGG
ncbi:MAG TPA: hypothetical protein VF310_13450 [Vicinamibacteria bacterium]